MAEQAHQECPLIPAVQAALSRLPALPVSSGQPREAAHDGRCLSPFFQWPASQPALQPATGSQLDVPAHHIHPAPLLTPPQALAKGPLAITIWADSNPDIQLYSTGIYAPPALPSAHEDHAVALVGYGTERLASGKEADYWIIKNRQACCCFCSPFPAPVASGTMQ